MRRSRSRGARAAGLLLFLLSAPGLAAQERGDSLAADTLAQDTAQVDTVFHTLPRLARGAEPGVHTGVWLWERGDLYAAPAKTLDELLHAIPGVVPLRGGDYGTPRGATAFGLGGGRIRVFLDGFELVPLTGAVPELSRIPLAGLESVRVERGMGSIRIELESFRPADYRAMSLVEAGTGDLDTNFFRGTFVQPQMPVGSLGLSLERLDTRGRGGDENGTVQGGWLRYTLHRGDRAGLRVEYRQGRRETSVDSVFPAEVTRSDWVVRGRAELLDGVVVDAFTGGSSVEAEDDGLTPIEGSRRQHGLQASLDRGPLWARGAFRLFGGPDLPSSSVELEAGAADPRVGGASLRWSRDAWPDEAATLTDASAWTRPVLGLSAFASWSSGVRGARIFPVRAPIPDAPVDGGDGGTGDDGGQEPADTVPEHRFTDGTSFRAGARFRWGPFDLSGAWLSQEVDSLLPLGTFQDRGGLVLPGTERTGWEAVGRVAIPFPDGFSLYGSIQSWDEEARYLPKRVYRGGLHFHKLFLESGNLEIWGNLGVTGHDPMLVPFEAEGEDDGGGGDGESPPLLLESTPFQQSWDAYLQIRVVTVRIFVRYDNFTLRDRNQDFPGRLLPRTRATYGVRWVLWN